EIGKVCGLYSRLMSELDESNMEISLNRALEVLQNVKILKHSWHMRHVFKTYLHWLSTGNINDIALIRIDSKSIISENTSLFESDSKIFDTMEELPEMALKYKQIEGLSDKHIYLGKMLGTIDSTLENLKEERLADSKILNQVLLNWRDVLTQTMEGLKGKADIRIILRTKKVLPLDTLTLLLSIENTGESLAENLRIELMSSEAYQIMDKTKRIRILPHEREDSVEFRIRPNKNHDFRVEFNISFDDFEKKGKSVYFADMVSFIDIPSEFKYIPNPYITGGPIKPGSKDMFFGRNDVFEFVRNNISSITQKNVLILQGERRTGKTSILYQLQDELGPEYICVFLDGQEFGKATLDYLFYRMAKLISNACSQNGILVDYPPKNAFTEDPWYMFKDQFLETLRVALGDRYLVILFDEFEALELAVTNSKMDPEIFNYIRNLMQHEDKLVFIFSGLHRLEEMMQDYWGVMFNIAMYWKISFLAEAEARRLITKPVEGYNMLYDDLAVEKIIRATACHPYFVQLLCRFLVNRHNSEKRNYLTVQDVNEELVTVVEKAKPHFNYIWTLSSPNERVVLAILPEILRKKNIATMIDILKECEEEKLDIHGGKISAALKSLCTKDIVERISHGEIHYRFKVDFIRMWVEKYQPLDKVIEEIGRELKES
ncbi:MAG: ATP-binding protein, partial [Thermoplasmata archaeon]